MRVPLIAQLLDLAFKIFGVRSFEGLVKQLLKIVFWILLLIPMILLPLYYLVFSAVGLH